MKVYSTDEPKTSLKFFYTMQIKVTEIHKYNTIHTFTNMSPHITLEDLSVYQKHYKGIGVKSENIINKI